MKNYFPKLENFATKVFHKIQGNNRAGYSSICEYLTNNHNIDVKDVVPEESKPFTKQFYPETKNFILSDYLSLETKKLFAAAQVSTIRSWTYN